MSIPIICLAKAEEPHRFEVAKVTADLVCTTCKSPDIDFDESAAKTAATAPPAGVDWGSPYTRDIAYETPDGPVWMFRKGQKVRFYNSQGQQVGPEQANVAPAAAYAHSQGWRSPGLVDLGVRRMTASIDWRGDTHLGVGYLTGTAPNGDVYEVYSNPNSNPTPCSWVRYGPEGDTGLGSGIDAGRGYTTMQEAMAAAEEHA